MKTNDKIIVYLDDQMSAEEKAAFEKELSESKDLRDELNLLKDFNSGLGGLKNISADEDYFVRMIPNFRNKLGRKKKFNFITGLAYSVTTATAVIIIMLFVTNKNVKNEVPQVQSNTVTQQIVSTEPAQDAFSLSDQFGLVNMSSEEVASSDSLLNSMLVRELDLTPQSLSEISAGDNNATDVQTILQGVDAQEANAIYKELLHKKIL
jgi:hypothetical protein